MKKLLLILFLTAMAQVTFAQLQDGSSKSFVVQEGIQFYPNPANDVLNISLGEEMGKVDIKITTIIGTQLKTEVEKTGAGSYKAKINHLPSGYYLLVIDSDQASKKVYKFAKR